METTELEKTIYEMLDTNLAVWWDRDIITIETYLAELERLKKEIKKLVLDEKQKAVMDFYKHLYMWTNINKRTLISWKNDYLSGFGEEDKE